MTAAAAAVLSWPNARRPTPRRTVPIAAPAPTVAAAPDGPAPTLALPVVIDLVAAALACGLPPGEAVAAAVRAEGGSRPELRRVVDAMRLGADSDAAWVRAGPAYEPLARTLRLADRTGASAATALRRAASDARAARRRRAQVAAHRLGVQLVLPLGLATLPSFVLLGVVPVVVGLARQVLTG